MIAIKEVEIHVSKRLQAYFKDRFIHGGHDENTLNGLAEGCEDSTLVQEIDNLICLSGDVTIRKCEL